jgi:hypothetical protein
MSTGLYPDKSYYIYLAKMYLEKLKPNIIYYKLLLPFISYMTLFRCIFSYLLFPLSFSFEEHACLLLLTLFYTNSGVNNYW